MLRADAATRVQGQLVGVTASVGLVEIPTDLDLSPSELVAHADFALYGAKEAGRDTVTVNDLTRSEGADFQARLNWAERIRKALDEGGFVLFEQPILTLETGQMDRRELLLRMRTEHDELVEAGSFLAVAERFKQMPDIDSWVIRQALDGQQVRSGDGHAARLHVNVSGPSLSDPGFVSTLPRLLTAADVDEKLLVFEIAETAAIQFIDHAQRLSGQLRELGCEVVLDDFGSSFAAFSCLKALPFDGLKIDGALISQLAHSDIDCVAVRAIVDIAQGLGKRTIAKCVEDERTLELVRELGIDHAQGFHIGRPVARAQ
jgi:EAL domain-containing protein (putative c-di-GMP-specific phosphodiesterase class I)